MPSAIGSMASFRWASARRRLQPSRVIMLAMTSSAPAAAATQIAKRPLETIPCAATLRGRGITVRADMAVKCSPATASTKRAAA